MQTQPQGSEMKWNIMKWTNMHAMVASAEVCRGARCSVAKQQSLNASGVFLSPARETEQQKYLKCCGCCACHATWRPLMLDSVPATEMMFFRCTCLPHNLHFLAPSRSSSRLWFAKNTLGRCSDAAAIPKVVLSRGATWGFGQARHGSCRFKGFKKGIKKVLNIRVLVKFLSGSHQVHVKNSLKVVVTF